MAGQRVKFGESVDRALADLALDWFGNSQPSDGFDQLLRSTEAGAALQSELAEVYNASVLNGSVLDFQQAFAAGHRPAPRASLGDHRVGLAAPPCCCGCWTRPATRRPPTARA